MIPKRPSSDYCRGFHEASLALARMCANRAKVWKKWKTAVSSDWEAEAHAFEYLGKITRANRTAAKMMLDLNRLEMRLQNRKTHGKP